MPTKDPKKRKEIQKKADAKRAGKRARAWTAMMYPESAPEGWQEKLSELLVEAIISPLHDSDVWTEEDEAQNAEHVAGTPKKPHWHIVVSYKNPTTYETAKEVFDAIGAIMPPFEKAKVKDFQQMARYLCHLDQPQKHQYDTADVIVFGAIDYQRLIMASKDEDDMIDAITEFIDEMQFVSFSQFCRYVRTERPEWRVLVYHQYASLISRYIKSVNWELEKGLVQYKSIEEIAGNGNDSND